MTETGDLPVSDGHVLVAQTLNRIIPIGAIIPWHGDFDNTPELPEHFAKCNGQTIDDEESPYYGQELPDLNGENRFLRGDDTSGDSGGADSVQLSVSEMPSHEHDVDGWASGSGSTTTFSSDAFTESGSFSSRSGRLVRNTGGNEPHENQPPYMDVIWIMRIK